jgi:hypothetical protein
MSLDALTSPLYFFITPQGRAWQVSVDQQPPIQFRDRESAVEAALTGARRMWEEFRQRSGVRIQDEHGWRVLRTFGA